MTWNKYKTGSDPPEGYKDGVETKVTWGQNGLKQKHKNSTNTVGVIKTLGKIPFEALRGGGVRLRRLIGEVHTCHAHQIRRFLLMFLNTPGSRIDLDTSHIGMKESEDQQTDN
jgi:hypothetical protein